jgi:hypothetical protein
LELINKNAKSFAGEDGFDLSDDDEDEEKCCVCEATGKENPLFYQIFSSNTPYASIIDNRPIESFVNISICQHLIHKDCSSNKCPLDRTEKNGLLPVFDTDLSSDYPTNANMLLDLQMFKRLFVDPDSKICLTHISKVIASMITILEALDRIDPSVINSKGYRYLFKAIVKLFWHRLSIPAVDISSLSPLARLIFLFLGENPTSDSSNYTPKNIFDELVRMIHDSVKDDEALPFIRRSGILQNYLFNDDVDHLFDFDDFLEYRNLCENFKVREREVPPLKPAQIIKAPHNSVDLLAPPFNDNVHDYNSNTFYCLLDNTIHRGELNAKNHADKYGGNLIPFIRLTGRNALEVHVFCKHKYTRILNPIYTSEDGVGYIGWSRDAPLILNRERVTKLENSLLTQSILHSY